MTETTIAALGESRVAGTVDLMQLFVEAKKAGFEKNIPDGVAANLDENGNHVLTLVQTYVHGATPHFRISVLVKLRDSGKPYCALLDVAADRWPLLLLLRDTQPLDENGRPNRLPSRLI